MTAAKQTQAETVQPTDENNPNNTHEPRQPIDKAVLVSFVGHSLFLFAIAIIAGMMIYRYHYGEYGHRSVLVLRQTLAEQHALNAEQARKLDRLYADVQDLKTGLLAIEEHARADLGLIKSGEIFVQLATVGEPSGDMPKVGREPDAVEALEADTQQ